MSENCPADRGLRRQPLKVKSYNVECCGVDLFAVGNEVVSFKYVLLKKNKN
jgi:hypothetical protein